MKIKHQETDAFFSSLKEVLSEGVRRLGDSSENLLDAQVLLCAILNKDISFLYTHPEIKLENKAINLFFDYINRRKKGEPVAYILKTKEFFGLPFYIQEGILIPRPETEMLVELALEQNKKHLKLLDLCCGSGAIGLSVKATKPSYSVTLSDISDTALKVSQTNSENLNLDVELIKSDLFKSIQSNFDMILTNPPYISESEYQNLSRDIKKYEPEEALLAGIDGLEFIRKIAQESPQHLNKEGLIGVEIGYKQGKTVKGLFEKAGFRNVEIRKDLAGLDRLIVACL